MKSTEWKTRIAGHITTFRDHHARLQQKLSIQIASDVNGLVDSTKDMEAKMDILINHVFTPNSDWEKAMAVMARQFSKLKDAKNLYNNLQYLEAVVLDSKLNQEGLSGNNKAAIDQLQKDLRLSVLDMCKENKESFEHKLNYHTQQLEKSMKTNADYIVKKLSGPYDRLKHKVCSLYDYLHWLHVLMILLVGPQESVEKNGMLASALLTSLSRRFLLEMDLLHRQ